MSTDAKIYIACLASYNAGILHGAWIDIEDDVDEVWAGIAQVLRTSPEPNIMRYAMLCGECGHTWDVGYGPGKTCPECDETEQLTVDESYPSAEEWAIHDFEGFCGFPVSEGESPDDLIRMVELIEEHGDFIGEVAAHYGGNLDDAENAMENYHGAWEKAADYAEEYHNDCGSLKNVPDSLAQCIDWDGVARGLDLTEIRVDGVVHLFNQW